MKNISKRILFLILALSLLVSMSIPALAENINLGVTITTTDDTITVKVDDSIQLAPDTTLTVNCSFSSAQVALGETPIDSTLADGKITFPVTQGGTYVISKSTADTPIQGENSVTLTYNGQTVTVGIGILSGVSGSEYITLANSDIRESVDADAADPSMSRPICFAAMVIDADNTSHVSSFYSQEILNSVSFEILSCKNADGTDQSPRKLSMSTAENRTYDNVTSKFVDLTAQGKDLFDATIAMHFTYNSQEYVVTSRVWREEDSVSADPSDTIDTTAELNSILASNENLFDWLEDVHPDVYEDFVSNSSSSVWIDLTLPAVEYGDVVSNVNYTGNNTTPNNKQFNLRISGSEEGSTATTMKSLKTKGSIWYVANVNFVGDSTHTIAIAPVDDYGRLPDNILNCTFKNYSRAVSLTGWGNVACIEGCTFDSCTTGIYVDSRDGGSYNFTAPTDYIYNVFFNNATAVHIAALPPMVSPFSLRINRNLFLGNSSSCVDFNVAPAGKFFFQQNFYGNTAKDSSSGSNSVDYWLTNHTGSNSIRTHARNASGNSGNSNGTKLITNPFLKTIGDWKTSAPSMWLTDSDTALTQIITSEAASMPVDGAAFGDDNTTKPITVTILDSNGQNTIAEWNFNGTNTAE